jgi:hypothetical protein
VENSILFFNALKKSGVKGVEMHIFKSGGHGFGLRDAKGGTELWPKLAEEWLISSLIIERKSK